MDHLISPSKLQRNIRELFILSFPGVAPWSHRWPLKAAITSGPSTASQSQLALSISMSRWSKCTLVCLLRVDFSHRWPLKAVTLGPNTAKQSRSILSTCMSWCTMVSLLLMMVVVLVSPVSHYDPTGGHQRPPPPRVRAPPGSRAQIVAKRTSRDLVLLLCKVILSKHRFSRELRTCFQQWPDPAVAIDVEVIQWSFSPCRSASVGGTKSLFGEAVIHVSSGQQALSKTEAGHVIWVDLRTWWWWWGRREPPLIVVDQLKQYLRPVFGKQGKQRKAPLKWATATIALCLHGLLRIILETKIQDEKLWQLPKSAQIAKYLTFKPCAERKEQVGGIIRSLATFYSASTAGWVADENAQKLWILGASQVNSQGGKYSNVSFTFRTSCPCFLDKTVQVFNAEYFGGQIP